MANEEGRMRCTIGGIDHWQDGDGTWWYREDHKARVSTLAMMPYLDALAAAQAENARLREELRAIVALYDDSRSVGELASSAYDMSCCAQRALAAPEGTR